MYPAQSRHALGVVLAAAFALSVAGCYVLAPWSELDTYKGPRKPDSEIAVVLTRGAGSWVSQIKKGGDSYYDEPREPTSHNALKVAVRLEPGAYTIVYSGVNYKTAPVTHTDTVDLIAGHVYRPKTVACYFILQYFSECSFNMKSYTTYLWLEDNTTGAIVAGSKS